MKRQVIGRVDTQRQRFTKYKYIYEQLFKAAKKQIYLTRTVVKTTYK